MRRAIAAIITEFTMNFKKTSAKPCHTYRENRTVIVVVNVKFVFTGILSSKSASVAA